MLKKTQTYSKIITIIHSNNNQALIDNNYEYLLILDEQFRWIIIWNLEISQVKIDFKFVFEII